MPGIERSPLRRGGVPDVSDESVDFVIIGTPVEGIDPTQWVEPLDDADIDSFFDIDSIDVDFQVTYYPRLVVAPAGGVGDSVTVTVRPK